MSNLEDAADGGDAVAAENLKALSELTVEEKQRLAEYLKGGFESEFDNSVSEEQGDVRVTTSRERSSWGTSTKYISVRTYVTFINVKVMETQVTGIYEVGNGRVNRVLAHTCNVTRNYDLFSQVTTEKTGSYVSGNQASFLCNVTVKRGAPTPWGPISWSTRSATQFAVGNSRGHVVNSGWM
ncbi:hypothetical protein [Corynebacterium sp. CCM 9204]|uniref:hypothetical protein n=1 Tax=Corynebacterium sp. CCM 9204 TaxID=3057616 RepID=UPI0035263835